MYEKPLPIIDSDSKPYWDAAKEGKLLIQRCQDTGKHFFYPRPFVPGTGGRNIEWVEAAGTGIIYSCTVAYRAGPAFAEDTPFVVAIVTLEEGPRMLSNVITDDPESVKIGDKVKVVFDKVTEEVTLPKFQVI